VRVFVDASCPRLLVTRPLELGHEVDYAIDIEPAAADEVWARRATERGQVLVTQDYDFGQLAEAGATPFGVVQIAPARGPLEGRVERVVAVLVAEADRLAGAITVVEPNRVRRRVISGAEERRT